ncbi:lysosomal alpha-mannosidase [Acrasis kona]|uniref:Lysosomal alpha-mannosidase n=1 Tax=Acrasis kona TaxID=1008807 RepID=A0AAW2ZA04_9EUKA
MRSPLVLVILCAIAVATLSAPLKVHVIPHSHCDPGWLKTYEGYYTEQVEKILTTVTSNLLNDQSLRFVWVEQVFFQRWWKSANKQTQKDFRTILERGQIEFLNGGWVMHDDAVTTYSAMIDQTTMGHQFISAVFGDQYLPRVGWTIDPFGLSSVSPMINKGFKQPHHVINRISYDVKQQFKKDRAMEFRWRYDPNHDDDEHETFTHVMHSHYGSISGFNFDYGDDPVTDSNIEKLSKEFVDKVTEFSKAYRTEHVSFPFGNDFQYVNASINFINMNKILKYVNEHYKDQVEAKYSKVTEYFDAVYPVDADMKPLTKTEFPTYKGDFFPYADSDASYWSGYFVSRPRLKGRVREGERISRTAETLYAIANVAHKTVAGGSNANYENLYSLRHSNGLCQHHDGITGTEKPFVEDDYMQWLEKGINEASITLGRSAASLVSRNNTSENILIKFANDASYLTQLKSGDRVPIYAYNNLAWSRQGLITLTINTDKVKVAGVSSYQVSPLGDGLFKLTIATQTLTPFGLHSFVLYVTDAASSTTEKKNLNNAVLSNGVMQVTYDQEGKVSALKNNKENVETKLKIEYLEYESYAGPGQASGAYIFRSKKKDASFVNLDGATKPEFTEGAVSQQVSHKVNNYITATTNVYKFEDRYGGMSHAVDLDLTVGVVPGNREVVVRLSTDITSDGKLFTDNNGLLTLERSRTDKPSSAEKNLFPTASNFYPIVYHAYIKDDSRRLTVVTNTSRGVASLMDGSIEVMLHRRTNQDDSRGVGHALDDQTTHTVKLRILLDRPTSRSSRAHVAHRQNYPVDALAFEKLISREQFERDYVDRYSPLTREFSPSAHVLDLHQQRDPKGRESTLIRTVNIDQDSEQEKIELSGLFVGAKEQSFVETSLNARKPVKEQSKLSYSSKPFEFKTFNVQY